MRSPLPPPPRLAPGVVRAVGRTVAAAAALLTVLLFAWTVWPTPWRYDHLRIAGDVFPVRTARLGGTIEVLTPRGWVRRAPARGTRTGAPADQFDPSDPFAEFGR